MVEEGGRRIGNKGEGFGRRERGLRRAVKEALHRVIGRKERDWEIGGEGFEEEGKWSYGDGHILKIRGMGWKGVRDGGRWVGEAGKEWGRRERSLGEGKGVEEERDLKRREMGYGGREIGFRGRKRYWGEGRGEREEKVGWRGGRRAGKEEMGIGRSRNRRKERDWGMERGIGKVGKRGG